MLRTLWILEAQLRGLHRGMTSATGLRTILVKFWQRKWLLFALV